MRTRRGKRKDPRTKDKSDLRAPTKRRNSAEREWEQAKIDQRQRELADLQHIARAMRSLNFKPLKSKERYPERDIIRSLTYLSKLYGDPILKHAAARLYRYGLVGSGWRKKAKEHQGMWANIEVADCVLAVEALVQQDVPLVQAYERVATKFGIHTSQHHAAVGRVKSRFQRWRRKSAEERAPVMFIADAPDPDATAGRLEQLSETHATRWRRIMRGE